MIPEFVWKRCEGCTRVHALSTCTCTCTCTQVELETIETCEHHTRVIEDAAMADVVAAGAGGSSARVEGPPAQVIASFTSTTARRTSSSGRDKHPRELQVTRTLAWHVQWEVTVSCSHACTCYVHIWTVDMLSRAAALSYDKAWRVV